jgi:hypothetical protein
VLDCISKCARESMTTMGSASRGGREESSGQEERSASSAGCEQEDVQGRSEGGNGYRTLTTVRERSRGLRRFSTLRCSPFSPHHYSTMAPTTTRAWIIANKPTDAIKEDTFKLVSDRPLPELKDKEVLVKVRSLLLSFPTFADLQCPRRSSTIAMIQLNAPGSTRCVLRRRFPLLPPFPPSPATTNAQATRLER